MVNEMMDRPVVDTAVLDFLRFGQKPLDGELLDLQMDARARKVPVIPHETVSFLRFLLPVLRPKHILEVGTAIGFSATLMAKYSDAKITTIDRYPVMIEEARNNFAKMQLEGRITLLEGHADEVLAELADHQKQHGGEDMQCEQKYDFIFMDCSKAQYIKLLPYCLTLLSAGGIIVVDDIFQGGSVFEDEENVPRAQRKIHRRLREFLELVTKSKQMESTILPLGDGIIMIRKSVV
jgi:predicted O-methyltransferase YrrM